MLLVFGAPGQLRSLAGQEYGRTIPLKDRPLPILAVMHTRRLTLEGDRHWQAPTPIAIADEVAEKAIRRSLSSSRSAKQVETFSRSKTRFLAPKLTLNCRHTFEPSAACGWSDALVMAIWRRGKPDALLHHSDRGSQYTSEQFQKLMSDHGVVCSMSRSGNVWDNAAMESFFSSLKTERTARKTYRTRDQAKADVFDYIECFYNPKRRHSTIGYLSPVEFEMQTGFA